MNAREKKYITYYGFAIMIGIAICVTGLRVFPLALELWMVVLVVLFYAIAENCVLPLMINKHLTRLNGIGGIAPRWFAKTRLIYIRREHQYLNNMILNARCLVFGAPNIVVTMMPHDSFWRGIDYSMLAASSIGLLGALVWFFITAREPLIAE